MKTTMSDFDLLPSSDLLLDENKVRLYHYWNALRNETLEHFMRTKEMIPFSILHKRLVLEFSIDIERLSDLWAEGADIVEGPIDLDAGDEIEGEIDSRYGGEIDWTCEHCGEKFTASPQNFIDERWD